MQVSSRPYQAHDLIKLSLCELDLERAPEWVRPSLELVPFAVVRRAKSNGPQIPIGVRGSDRNERWACLIKRGAIVKIVTPETLSDTINTIAPSRIAEIPALSALATLSARLANTPWKWGPTGSVGFELASGSRTAKPTSDLDLILRCKHRVEKIELRSFNECLKDLCVRCDTVIETPNGGVALVEYLNETEVYALRTINGPLLTHDPWQ